jgi:hypothetical protein
MTGIRLTAGFILFLVLIAVIGCQEQKKQSSPSKFLELLTPGQKISLLDDGQYAGYRIKVVMEPKRQVDGTKLINECVVKYVGQDYVEFMRENERLFLPIHQIRSIEEN